MEQIHLVKMHGARNDFIVVDARERPLERAPEAARRLCDRRSGVGADGLLLVVPSSVASVGMQVFNADGSEAEMCGNGIRCVARYLDEAGEGGLLEIETAAGVIETRVMQREPEYLVRVAIGTPELVPCELGIEDAVLVDVGNPHVVLARPDLDEARLVKAARALQHSPALANGANVHECAPDGDGIRVLHWERGVGLTQACGTGAVACAIAAMRRSNARSPLRVRTPGGALTVEWDGSGVAHLTGPAERVFETSLDPWSLSQP